MRAARVTVRRAALRMDRDGDGDHGDPTHEHVADEVQVFVRHEVGLEEHDAEVDDVSGHGEAEKQSVLPGDRAAAQR